MDSMAGLSITKTGVCEWMGVGEWNGGKWMCKATKSLHSMGCS